MRGRLWRTKSSVLRVWQNHVYDSSATHGMPTNIERRYSDHMCVFACVCMFLSRTSQIHSATYSVTSPERPKHTWVQQKRVFHDADLHISFSLSTWMRLSVSLSRLLAFASFSRGFLCVYLRLMLSIHEATRSHGTACACVRVARTVPSSSRFAVVVVVVAHSIQFVRFEMGIFLDGGGGFRAANGAGFAQRQFALTNVYTHTHWLYIFTDVRRPWCWHMFVAIAKQEC